MRRIEFALFLAGLVFLAFLAGFAASHYRLSAVAPVATALDGARTLREETFSPDHLSPAVYELEGARVLDAGSVEPGVTLLTTYWPELDWRAGIKVVDAAGRTLHTWDADPLRIWPEAKRRRELGRKYVHGSYLFPDGDVLFNVEYEGLVRMDSCGTIRWILPQKTHHSVARDHEGNFWVCGIVDRGPAQGEPEFPARFPGLRAPWQDDLLLKVSPDGEPLARLSVLEVLYDNGLQRYLARHRRLRVEDPVHLNDVEPLAPDLAAEYPLFAAGDLLVSLRNIHLVLVLDPRSGRVKWHADDPFIAQHDPDFIGGGWIGLFDNNRDQTLRGEMLGGSRIVALRPHTGEEKVLYPTPGAAPFYTPHGGKWQLLDNSNLLITEARAGRVFEVTPGGRTVWEWYHRRFGRRMVAEVLEGTRYAYGQEQVAGWPCPPAPGD